MVKNGTKRGINFWGNKLGLKLLLEHMHYTKDHEIHFIWHIVQWATRTFATDRSM